MYKKNTQHFSASSGRWPARRFQKLETTKTAVVLYLRGGVVPTALKLTTRLRIEQCLSSAGGGQSQIGITRPQLIKLQTVKHTGCS